MLIAPNGRINNMSKNNKDLSEFLGKDGLAVYASRPEDSRGRLHDEAKSKTRNNFERDRDRIIYSEGFRKLKFKTQVFVYHEGDNYRTRLSHSIEVAQVARYLARIFKANEDLAETCALAHDLGHAPFAHAGQDVLHECMENYGGFDHNDQTLRVITGLENKYPNFRGLNLCWESLEGLIKHGGPITNESEARVTLNDIKNRKDFMLDKYSSIEAQAAGIADDIAYNSHDLEDGLRAGMFTLKDLAKVGWVDEIIKNKLNQYPNISDKIMIQEVIRDVMGGYTADVVEETIRRIRLISPKNSDDIRNAGMEMVSMSDEMKKKNKELKKFLYNTFYKHHHLARMKFKALRIIKDLFNVFMENHEFMPVCWDEELKNLPKSVSEKNFDARIVADYIASMTDKTAIATHENLFGNYNIEG